MARNSTGAITTNEALRLEISTLMRLEYLKYGSEISASISWNNGSWIRIHSKFTGREQEVRLIYQINRQSEEKKDLDYKIQLTSVPSNLGRGKIWYFVCPQSGRRAKILYKAYGSLIFKSRKAYQKRIYYPSQMSSKLEFHNDRYWELDKKLEKMKPLVKIEYYKGKETKLFNRIKHLEEKMEYHDFKRWITMPKSLLKVLKT